MSGREAAFLPELGFLPVHDFSSGEKEGDAAFFCALGVLAFLLLSLVFCSLPHPHCGSRHFIEDKTLAWIFGSDFDPLGDLGQLT